MRTRAYTLADELVAAGLAGRLEALIVPMRPQPGVIRLGGAPVWVWPPNDSLRTTDRTTWTIGCPVGQVGDRDWSNEVAGKAWHAAQDAFWARPDIREIEKIAESIPAL